MQKLFSPERQIISPSLFGLEEVLAFGRYNYSTAHAPLNPHLHHGVYEICYLERGAQVYVVGADSHRITGGDFFVTKPGEVHGTGAMPECPGRLYWIQFVDPKKSKKFLGLKKDEAGELREMLDALPRRFRGNASICRQMRKLFEPLEGIPEMLRPALLRGRILELLLEIGGLSTKPLPKSVPVGVNTACRYIHQNIETPISISEAARIARMSESYFKAAFAEAFGMPPASYMRLARLEHACSLLRESSLSTTEIAIRLGFSSSQHFATAFRKQYGVTPGVFRHSQQSASKKIAIGSGAAFHPTTESSAPPFP